MKIKNKLFLYSVFLPTLVAGCTNSTVSTETTHSPTITSETIIAQDFALADATEKSIVTYPHENFYHDINATPSDIAYANPTGDRVKTRFEVPDGYTRIETNADTFASYLQNMPLLPDGTPLFVYDGTSIDGDEHHAAVFDIDIGQFNLQQCADSVLRFWGEYLYQSGRYGDICFPLPPDINFAFSKWADGYSLKEDEYGKLYWLIDTENNAEPLSFRHYMNRLFNYAGTTSLYEHTSSIASDDISIGDIFVKPKTSNASGHAVIIVDMAEDENHNRICLIAEGHILAQSIHITQNITNKEWGAWYPIDAQTALKLKTDTFTLKDAHRLHIQ